MPTKEKLTDLFKKKKKTVKEFMKVAGTDSFGVVSGSLKESAFSDDEKLGKICTALGAIFCEKSNVELKKPELLGLIHELSHPTAKIFNAKYKMGKRAGLDIRNDFDIKIADFNNLGLDDKAKKSIEKFKKVLKDKDVPEGSEDEIGVEEVEQEVLETILAVTYLKEAEQILAEGAEIKTGIAELDTNTGEIIRTAVSESAIMTKAIISAATSGLEMLEDCNIDLYKSEYDRWKKNIPRDYTSGTADQKLNILIKKIDNLMKELVPATKKNAIALSILFGTVKTVEDPRVMATPPVTGDPGVAFFSALKPFSISLSDPT